MRLYDAANRRSLDDVSLLLTREELQHLIGAAETLLQDLEETHVHVLVPIEGESLAREINLIRAEPEDLKGYSPEIRALFGPSV